MRFMFTVSCKVADEILSIREVLVTKRGPLFCTCCNFSICVRAIVLSGTVGYVNVERTNYLYSFIEAVYLTEILESYISTDCFVRYDAFCVEIES